MSSESDFARRPLRQDDFKFSKRRSPPTVFDPWNITAPVATALDDFRRRGADARRTIREMTKEIGLSQRRFIRVFTAEVGLTPKLFDRIQRFQRAVSLASTSAVAPDWPQLALRSVPGGDRKDKTEEAKLGLPDLAVTGFRPLFRAGAAGTARVMAISSS